MFQILSSMNLYSGGYFLVDLRKYLICLLKILGAIVSLSQVYGCTSQISEITLAERNLIHAAEKAIVLLKVQCTIDNHPHEAFIEPSLTNEPIFLFGLGTFDTVGEPHLAGHRFLSEESRRAGWTYFILPPGIYYLAVLGPDSSVLGMAGTSDSQRYIQDSPRWRLIVPENAKLIYVGTLQFTGKSDGKLLFGGKIIRPIDKNEAELRDDRAYASSLLSEYFPNEGEIKTILLEHWHPGDPIIIQTPKHKSTR